MIGKTVSHYKILEKLGGGGMGIVYKAQDLRLDRLVALKLLPPTLILDVEAKERFIHEAKAASALQHNNICSIHDIDETPEGQMFMVMDCYEGETLRDRIGRGPLKIEEAIDIAIQISQGLQKAHEKGIVHRDIKPANIFITKDGIVKILDFGLAKLSGGTMITKNGTTLGTAAYMSPEQARGEEVDQRTDIWSLAVILYEMLTGLLPFRGEHELAIMYSITNEEPQPIKKLLPDIPAQIDEIFRNSLAKNRDTRYSSAADIMQDLKAYHDAHKQASVLSLKFMLRRLTRPRVLLTTALLILFIAASSIWYFNRLAKIRWAREEAIPEITRLFHGQQVEGITVAYDLACKAERYIPNDSSLNKLMKRISWYSSIHTNPPEANVYRKAYTAYADKWEFVGRTPIKSIRLPFAYYRWKIEKTGYEIVTFTSKFAPTLYRILDKEGNIPKGMIRVLGDSIDGIGKFDDFFIDIYEVTNKQYKEFVDNGGYQKPEYWKHPFIKDGRVLTWKEAMFEFRDATGRPSPSTWKAGDYPDGQDDFPVSGVSWYEAAAYAEYSRKSLPTVFHWEIAAGQYNRIHTWFLSQTIRLCNFNGKGPAPVGSYQGINSCGAFDMAGNVREWCWNESPDGRFILGSAWNEVPYRYQARVQLSPFNRSETNGFRCVKYLDKNKIPETAFKPITIGTFRDYSKEKPVSDDIFQVYKNMYNYDSTDLDPVVEWKDESSEDWIRERITFNAAYDNERIIAYLFLPKGGTKPYQTVVYFPGVGAQQETSSKNLKYEIRDFYDICDFIVKNGRALMYPVYLDTYERGVQTSGFGSYQWTQLEIKQVKDFRRSIDYLVTRPDINTEKLAYYGLSSGGWMGIIISAVEERLKVSILYSGGLTKSGYDAPECDPLNFAPRIKIPILMLNGKYDYSFPMQISQIPLYQLLGTPKKDKFHKTYEADHFIPTNELIKEVLGFLDKYLGPVR